MRNTQKGFVIPLIILLVVAAAIGGGVYQYQKQKTASVLVPALSSNGTQSTSMNADVATKKPAISNNTNTPVPTKAETANEKIVTECVSVYQLKQGKYPTSNYATGEVVVGFSASTSLAEAKRIISSYGLTSRDSAGQFYSRLYADVAVGQEFLWACKLKQDKGVLYADPNYTASIGV